MSKAPDNASGAGMEQLETLTNCCYGGEWVDRTDASRLLAEKDAELQRLREACAMACSCLDAGLKVSPNSHAHDTLRAALNP